MGEQELNEKQRVFRNYTHQVLQDLKSQNIAFICVAAKEGLDGEPGITVYQGTEINKVAKKGVAVMMQSLLHQLEIIGKELENEKN